MSALLRLSAWLLALALVALPVVAVLNGWIGSEHWPLTRLRVTAEFERVDPARLRETVLPYAREGFFAVRLDEAQQAVAALPWVAQAQVRKRWPDVLEVQVTEHHPFARWGDERLLSDRGVLFQPAGADIAAALPQLRGPEARVGDVVALYNESRALFAPIGLQVREVALDARGSWSLQLHNVHSGRGSQVVVGRQQAQERLQRFARLIPQLLAQDAQALVRADLRYTNGFALSWAPVEDEPDSNARKGTT